MLDKCYWQLSNKSEAARHVQIPKGTIGNWLQKVKKLKEDEIRDAGEKSLTVQGQPVDTPAQHVIRQRRPLTRHMSLLARNRILVVPQSM